MDLSRFSTPQLVSGIAIIVVALAAFLPWVSVFGFSVSGIRGDGLITLILAVLGALSLATRTGLLDQVKIPEKAGLVASLVFAGLVTLTAFLDMNGAAAIGLYLTLFGGIAWVVGAVLELKSTQQESVAQSES
ncbi:hypothetical protein [Nocardioides astragali]|uniref:SPW repeat-containing protein n=1 Tax=Nocardioides astragali TaxID=1776736 RepID=A0ABW2MWB0_9ACTN|nr:hypothetical protein [Nocardioides astragali]